MSKAIQTDLLEDDVVESSKVAWKTGMSPAERNVAAGVKEDDPNAAYSLFELFEEGPLSQDELPVLFALAGIAQDPLACYLGMEEQEDSMDEEHEEEPSDEE